VPSVWATERGIVASCACSHLASSHRRGPPDEGRVRPTRGRGLPLSPFGSGRARRARKGARAPSPRRLADASLKCTPLALRAARRARGVRVPRRRGAARVPLRGPASRVRPWTAFGPARGPRRDSPACPETRLGPDPTPSMGTPPARRRVRLGPSAPVATPPCLARPSGRSGVVGPLGAASGGHPRTRDGLSGLPPERAEPMGGVPPPRAAQDGNVRRGPGPPRSPVRAVQGGVRGIPGILGASERPPALTPSAARPPVGSPPSWAPRGRRTGERPRGRSVVAGRDPRA